MAVQAAVLAFSVVIVIHVVEAVACKLCDVRICHQHYCGCEHDTALRASVFCRRTLL